MRVAASLCASSPITVVVMVQTPVIVVMVMVVVPVIMAVVPVGIIGAVIIISTAIYSPMNTPVMAIVGLRFIHGQ
jgi:hypothetical protein